jgi:steroid delta-isomerase-like uncharacterized protein
MTARDTVDAFWQSYLDGDYEGVRALMADDVVVIMGGTLRLDGQEAVLGMLRSYAEAIPDIRHNIVNVVENGDEVATELRVGGTHTGTLQTPAGPLPPTGRTIDLPSVDMITVRDGKVQSWRAYYDNLAFMTQLGAIPQPTAV